MPKSYFGPRMVPGHKKDILNLAVGLRKRGGSVIILYNEGSVLYNEQFEKENYSLNDILSAKTHESADVIIGPLACFRKILFTKKKRPIFFYVFDSILKTSILAFLRKPYLIHRVVYGYVVELLLRSSNIIVASLDEYLWFASSGHAIDKINLITPMVNSNLETYQSYEENKKVIIYNPPLDSLDLCRDILIGIIQKEIDVEVLVTGNEGYRISKTFDDYKNIQFIPYVGEIDNMIRTCRLAVLTDISGSGFCNRAAQIRALQIPLICTLPSLRGTGLQYDTSVHVYNSAPQCVSILEDLLDLRNSLPTMTLVDIHLRSHKDIDLFDS